MAKARLHLDADISYRTLQKVLLQRGHDVTRTPCEWMALDADDEQQLLQASARGRSVLTYNVGDFMRLARSYPSHAGIVLAHQHDWTLPALIAAVDAMLTAATAEEMAGRVRWLNDWRGRGESP